MMNREEMFIRKLFEESFRILHKTLLQKKGFREKFKILFLVKSLFKFSESKIIKGDASYRTMKVWNRSGLQLGNAIRLLPSSLVATKSSLIVHKSTATLDFPNR